MPYSCLLVNKADIIGGAEKVVMNLLQAFRSRRHDCWLAVGYKMSNHPHVVQVPNERHRGPWTRIWYSAVRRWTGLDGTVDGLEPVTPFFKWISTPSAWLNYIKGYEYFNFPGTRHLLDEIPLSPDLLHVHNLHGEFFDLRYLPHLSRRFPLVLTLNDTWLLGGGCCHFFDCGKWKTGCGNCPNLTIIPALKRDGTVKNWRLRERVLKGMRFFVTTPSNWLMDKVKQSPLMRGMVQGKVIPNGVDLNIFHPFSLKTARKSLALPIEVPMVLAVAKNIRQNIFKDYGRMESSVIKAAAELNTDVLFLALGEDGKEKKICRVTIHFIPFQNDPWTVARYYQAADVFIHAVRADTFPNVVLEAMACGKPVIATKIGGIPEQLNDGETGILTHPEDDATLTSGLVNLLRNDSLRIRLGGHAAEWARKKFNLDRQVDDYLALYEEIIAIDSGSTSEMWKAAIQP